MNREVMQQALDALEDSVPDSSELVGDYLAKYGERYRPKRLAAMRKTVVDGEAAIAALRAELAKPGWPIDPYYKKAIEDHIAEHTGKSQARQNCNRHPSAPHGVDIEASFRAGHTVCKCASWAPGDAS